MSINLNISSTSILITNGENPDEKVYIQFEKDHIVTVDICRGNNPVKTTRVDSRLTFQEFVSIEGGTLRWPMK